MCRPVCPPTRLAVLHLMGDTRMSPRARIILASWSSFDDPLTVVLAIYAAATGMTLGPLMTPAR